MWAQQEQRSPAIEDSEWNRKFEEPWQSRPRDWRGVGQVFLQACVKGLGKSLQCDRVEMLLVQLVAMIGRFLGITG